MNFTIRSLLGLILISAVAFFSFQVIEDSKVRQEIVIENAEIKNIKYGLLSVYSWKRQVSDIVAKKVRDFELTAQNRRELKSRIQSAMYQLLDEVNRIIREKRNQESWLERVVRSIFETLVFDIDDLRGRVPEFTDIILDELDNYETREKLRVFIQNKIDELLYKTVGEEDLSKIEFIAAKYDCSEIDDCGLLLQSKLEQADQELKRKGLLIVGIASLVFFLILAGNKNIAFIEYVILVILCGILLFAGVNSPMIDIDARIENFHFLLMGEPLEFNDQILFFQSKSIFEVVKILTLTGEYQSVFVGILIFMFSIIFPVSKLIASFLLLVNRNLYDNSIIRFLALKSGKWSMADVVVVAIFMSYIGFRGIIENQLAQLENISEKVEILTTDNSNFGIGFILFLAFCLGGLVLAMVMEKNLQNNSLIGKLQPI